MKFLIYFFIVAVGGVLLVFVYITSKETIEQTGFAYDLLLGIGGGFVSSALATIFLLVILPDESEQQEELQEWGMRSILSDRSELQIDLLEETKEKLDIIAFGLTRFRNANRDIEAIAERIDKGLSIRIITLNPYSVHVSELQLFENSSTNLKNDILNLEDWVNEINNKVKSKQNKIQIRFYDDIPLDFYCRCDSRTYVGPYIPISSNNKLITYMYEGDSKGSTYYNEMFQKIWNGRSNISLSEIVTEALYVKQEYGIESIMEYFCAQISPEKSKVIGVIAVFKDKLRRTFCSCNKAHLEMHRVHNRDEGTVGVLLQQLKENKRTAIFSDYKNTITYIKQWQDRSSEIFILNQNPLKLKNNEETAAVLAIPIYKDSDSVLGVLTFDFADLPGEYMNQVTAYTNLKATAGDLPRISITKNNEDVTELDNLFENARQCEKLIVNFIGQELKKDYKKFYEKEWSL